MLNNKKAISTVVATVLIILITVAAVAILWATVMPLISDKLSGANDDCSKAQMGLQVITENGKTCINSTNYVVSVQIARDSEAYNLTGVKVLGYDSNGNTVGSASVKVGIPAAGEQKTIITTGVSLTNAVKVGIVPLVGSSYSACGAPQQKTALITCVA